MEVWSKKESYLCYHKVSILFDIKKSQGNLYEYKGLWKTETLNNWLNIYTRNSWLEPMNDLDYDKVNADNNNLIWLF